MLQLKEKCGTCIYDDKYGDIASPVPETHGFGIVGNGNKASESFRLVML